MGKKDKIIWVGVLSESATPTTKGKIYYKPCECLLSLCIKVLVHYLILILKENVNCGVTIIQQNLKYYGQRSNSEK